MMRIENGAEGFVEALGSIGVDRIFLNPGSDIIPIQGAIGRLKEKGRKTPAVILVPHESAAIAAAHGYAMVSGKPQVVVLHEDIGTIHGGGSIINLQYGRAPVVLVAGKKEAPSVSNWAGEPFDQRRITRDYVKWDHSVSPGEDIASVVAEALRVASAEPCGPVFLSVDRRVFAGKMGEAKVEAPVTTEEREIDTAALSRAVDLLAGADDPLLLTSYYGRHPESVPHLVDLAETLGLRVVTSGLRMSFPVTHPLCAGIDSNRQSAFDRYIADADLIFLLDYDFPPPLLKTVRPRQDAKIVHIDNEPLKKGRRLFDRVPDVLVEGDSARILPVMAALAGKRQPEDGRIRERIGRLAGEHRSMRDEWDALAERSASESPISPEWLSFCLNRAMGEDGVLVHMVPTGALAVTHQMTPSAPGSIFSWGDGGGAMGWPLGAALGARLAGPERTVVALTGDGGFMYGSPIAALWAAGAYGAPFLTVVCNNGSYGAMRRYLKAGYGDDAVAGDRGFEVGVDLPSPPDYAAVARACGAYGKRVENPSVLPSALKKAFSEVRKGRPAVLDVIVGRP